MESKDIDRNTERLRVIRRDAGMLSKFVANLPWLACYPGWRARELLRRTTEKIDGTHIIMVVANHFEPCYNEEPNEIGGYGIELDLDTQLRRVDHWSEQARSIGDAVRDHDGTPFRHTNFYPAEQYHPRLLERLMELQADGFGEVEIHLHHGVEKADSAENFKRVLVDFRDALAEEHKGLSREHPDGKPMYAFVHGNWALANSAGGKYCGVDSEMQILAETGCYADFTLPSAPEPTQVPRINAIYQCGHPLNESKPHRSGENLKVGSQPALPVIFTGPLVFDWRHGKGAKLLPRLENGVLSSISPLDIDRFRLWHKAHISVNGRPDWVFIKLHCHGFFMEDQPATIGNRMREFLEKVLELSEQTGDFKLHFATTREAFNMAMAAVDGHSGCPHAYRDYRLRQIMQSQSPESQTKNSHAKEPVLTTETA